MKSKLNPKLAEWRKKAQKKRTERKYKRVARLNGSKVGSLNMVIKLTDF